jgi:E3 ubiquitin-protein ligase synoviolin
MARRLAYYAGASTAAAAACLLKAFHQRPNFYSATVYLSQSNACILIMTNLLLVTACWALYGLQRLLYGPLRPIEIEQLSEKAWYAVLDTLLAMPSFREDVGGWLLTMFVLLLAGKVWGWIAEGRVDILEQQPPADPRWFHARLATSLLVSVGFDLAMFRYCVKTVVRDPRPGMMVIFTFEFAILSIFSLFTLCRYLLSVAESQVQKQQTVAAIEARKQEIREERAAARQLEATEGEGNTARDAVEDEEPIEVDENEVDVPGWEEKRRYLFALEVLTDFVKLLIYMFFFVVSVTFNGLPMHIMRDVYMTFTAFSKRVADYVAYRRATSDMNNRYPDATSQEIQGDVCIICRETMLAWEQPAAPAAGQQAPANPTPAPPRRRDEGLRAKKLPCGHILHLRCLKAWLERQQVCPTCRRPVVAAEPAQTNAAAARPGAAANGAGAPNPARIQGGQQPPQNQGQQNQRPQAQGRAAPAPQPQAGLGRMFNLGPLRIGFLNGPQEQVQNFINQLQNPAAAAAAAAPAVARPPNGLVQDEAAAATAAAAQSQPESAAQQQPQQRGFRRRVQAHGAMPPFLRSEVHPASRAEQFTAMEQYIVQEAQNIRLEQFQLSRIAALYDELAQLQDQRNDSNQSSSSIPPIPGSTQAAPGTALPNPSLIGGSSQPLSNGDEGLPAGLVLPEGWTLTPLHPVVRGPSSSGAQAGTMNIDGSSPNPVQPQSQQNGLPAAPNPTTNISQNTNTASSTASTSTEPSASRGPTDERGSPLFVPTQPRSAQQHLQQALTPTSTIPITQPLSQAVNPAATSPSASTRPPTQSQPAHSAPSNPTPPTKPTAPQPPQPPAKPSTALEDDDEDDDDDEEDEEDEDESESSEEESSSNSWSFPKELSHPAAAAAAPTSGDKGKGKAKPVGVEEVEDPEA